MTETILLCEFDSLIDAMEYMNNTEYKFIFSVCGIIYSTEGVELDSEECLVFTEQLDLKTLHINEILDEIYTNPSEGQIYVKNNNLTFYTIK